MGAVRKERCPVVAVCGKVVGVDEKEVIFFSSSVFLPRSLTEDRIT